MSIDHESTTALEVAEQRIALLNKAIYRIEVERTTAERAAERRLALVKELEWGEEYATPPGLWWRDCPVCRRHNSEGHTPECTLAAEL